jgi:hypothetical protein
VWWQAADGDAELLRSRPEGLVWTPQELARDGARARAVLAVLADYGVSIPDVLARLKAAREAHNERMRAAGHLWNPGWTENGDPPMPAWRKHPNAHTMPTRRQRRKQLEAWLPFGEAGPWLKNRVALMRRELAGLERWGAYARPLAPRGRPQKGIASCVIALRAALPHQCGSHPIWEFVAVLARVTLPESLGPTFDGTRAKSLAQKHRQRRA